MTYDDFGDWFAGQIDAAIDTEYSETPHCMLCGAPTDNDDASIEYCTECIREEES